MLSDRLYLWVVGFLASLKLTMRVSDNLLLEEDVLVVAFIQIEPVDGVTSGSHGFSDFGQIFCVLLLEGCWTEALAVW